MVGEVVRAIRTVASFNAEHAFYLDYCDRVEKQAAKQKKEAWGKAVLVVRVADMVVRALGGASFVGGGGRGDPRP